MSPTQMSASAAQERHEPCNPLPLTANSQSIQEGVHPIHPFTQSTECAGAEKNRDYYFPTILNPTLCSEQFHVQSIFRSLIFPRQCTLSNSFQISVCFRPSVLEATIIRVSGCLLWVGSCVFCFLVYGVAMVVLGEEFFDFPVVLLGANGEFKIFSSDGIPILQQLSKPLTNMEGRRTKQTLYIIMTARRLQIVAKNKPSK